MNKTTYTIQCQSRSHAHHDDTKQVLKDAAHMVMRENRPIWIVDDNDGTEIRLTPDYDPIREDHLVVRHMRDQWCRAMHIDAFEAWVDGSL